MRAFPPTLALVGAGKMGGAMLAGWFSAGMPGEGVSVFDPRPSPALEASLAERGGALNPASPSEPAVLVLAVKPQLVDEAAPLLARLAGPGTLVVSVAAGKTVANLESRMPRARAVVRTIPNTPAAVGRGVTACFATPGVSEADRATATALLRAVGAVEWVDDEDLIDAATAVSGSGPAYVFLLAEALAAAGAAAGLPPDVAARLARATVEGAGELMFREPDVAPATLRENVTSPAGTTAAALAALMAPDGLQPLMTRAVAAAKRRAGELSG